MKKSLIVTNINIEESLIEKSHIQNSLLEESIIEKEARIEKITKHLIF